LDEDTYTAHDALLCVAEGTYVSTETRRRVTPQHRLKSQEEMAALFEDVPEALENTVQLAQRCHFLLKPRTPELPPYPTAKGRSQEDELKAQAKDGLGKRLLEEVLPAHDPDRHEEIQKNYEKRLDYELGVIIGMGFAGYFLIVADFIQWAKKQGIPVGAGRGSGASSLVAWALTITGVDPIRFQLLFERFLNPERVSMPDFDVDFCQQRRDEVIAYVQQKYGSESVAHIITFGKLQARAVLRDVGRVLQMPYSQVDKICKRIPYNPANPLSLEEALAQDPDLVKMGKEDRSVGTLLELSQKLEGLYRHASTHAAGVVIGGRPLVELLPLYRDARALLPATQFSMKYVEMAGLVKFDFLGLKTLTVLEEAVQIVQKRGKEVNLLKIPLDDEATFSLLRDVDVVGVFQLESQGMRDVLKRLQPEAFEEIIALVALYRPGPMDDIPRYIACRHGEETVSYPYPCLEDILRETFGVMIYQEQVLQIAQRLAGYSLGQADLLRRAMGKKIKSEMDAQRRIFIEGVLKTQGLSGSEEEAKAAQLFEQISKFAGYAFPKAHATPYALISYQTAYMKANHKVAFMAALLNQDLHHTDKLALFIEETKAQGIEVLSPCINTSHARFHVHTTKEKEQLFYGLGALKNVGEGAMEEIVQEREGNGPFRDIYHFFDRMRGSKALNKRQLEHLIWAGAFDALEPNRKTLVASLETLLKYSASKTSAPGLFSEEQVRPLLVQEESYTYTEKLKCAFDAFGMYFDDHPLLPFQGFMESVGCITQKDLENFFESAPVQEGFKMLGVLTSMAQKVGKSGKKYALFSFSDLSGNYDCMGFSEFLEEKRDILQPGKSYLLTLSGKVNDGRLRLILTDLTPLWEAFVLQNKTLMLSLKTEQNMAKASTLLEGLDSGRTSVETMVTVTLEGQEKIACVTLKKGVTLTETVFDQLFPFLETSQGQQKEAA
jgi:DNA polymerase-3 subunit alpha